MDSSKNCTRTKGRLVISFDHLHIISYENFRLWLLLLHVEIEEVVRKQKYFDHIEMKTFFLGFDFLTYFVGFEIACFETCRPVGRLALSLAGYQRVPLTHFQYSQYLAQPPTFDRFPLSWSADLIQSIGFESSEIACSIYILVPAWKAIKKVSKSLQ